MKKLLLLAIIAISIPVFPKGSMRSKKRQNAAPQSSSNNVPSNVSSQGLSTNNYVTGPVGFAEPVQVKNSQDIILKFSDKTVTRSKDSLKDSQSLKIKNFLRDMEWTYPITNELDLAMIDFQVFSFLEKLAELDDVALFSFLANLDPNSQAMQLINIYTNYLNISKINDSLKYKEIFNGTPFSYAHPQMDLLYFVSRKFWDLPQEKIMDVVGPSVKLIYYCWDFTYDQNWFLGLVHTYRMLFNKPFLVDNPYLETVFKSFNAPIQQHMIDKKIVVVA